MRPMTAWGALCILIPLFALAFIVRWVLGAATRGDILTGVTIRVMQIYVRLVHRLRVQGRENIPKTQTPGPLIVVANHSAGVDPVLIQSACRFEIRWLMAQDMKVAWLDPLWDWSRIIFIDRTLKGGAAGVREAANHVQSGGVIGIFPEGRIERPTRTLYPFLPGVGVLIARTGARVLPIVIEDAPEADPAWASLWTTSRATIRVMPILDYASPEGRPSPRDIVADLHSKFVEWTGWPQGEPAPADDRAFREPVAPRRPRARWRATRYFALGRRKSAGPRRR
ncbi:MAG: 1-acyl-sn-glycerol-3-phosphate acyltransferase [Phycisphaeraceae bacterium]|nr:1-acyl-sn-glycerol-3-phosphate acyltransferase [Phycisphaeraceae bacterium]MCB9847108.1 1-acyl-sn-glycerol-3-phosphate acyltransferase [Phycisphaeraceae bacterium]